jgi:hypothetical protein
MRLRHARARRPRWTELGRSQPTDTRRDSVGPEDPADHDKQAGVLCRTGCGPRPGRGRGGGRRGRPVARPGVGGQALVAEAVALFEGVELGAGAWAFAADQDPLPGRHFPHLHTTLPAKIMKSRS